MVVIVVIAIIIVLWLLWNLNKDSVCIKPRPEPVGGVKVTNLGPGEVKISWHKTMNAVKYRIFINGDNDNDADDAPMGKLKVKGPRPFVKAGPKVGCGQDCCPGTCDACVSQSNYKSLIETSQTEVVVETCQAEFCFIIVAYNECGQSGQCTTVYTANPQCTCGHVDAWVASSDCRGTTIKWHKPKCCEHLHIYVNSQQVEVVDASLETVTIPAVPEGQTIAVACESDCGMGAQVIISPPPHEEDSDSECDCEEDECHHRRHHHHHHDDECNECSKPRPAAVPGYRSRHRRRPAPRVPRPSPQGPRSVSKKH